MCKWLTENKIGMHLKLERNSYVLIRHNSGIYHIGTPENSNKLRHILFNFT